ncbi:ribonuclease HIII [Candidatus Dojkabacteria bacterium]|nr:ribonuclease HIII [Candidatus Dojkabacteria bacterium]
MVKSIKLNRVEWEIIEDKLDTLASVDVKSIPFGVSYKLTKGSVTLVLNVYIKGDTYSVVIQGKESDLQSKLNQLLETEIKASGLNKIGVDESGKGDLFGPLVVGGVYAGSNDIGKLVSMGVKDSKALSDKKILQLSLEIQTICIVDTVAIGPSTYNRLYNKLQNVNKILAWGHSRVIENLLGNKAVNCDQIVIDQFAKHKSRVNNVLMERGRKVEIIQKHKGESDVVVAAASIVARAEFVRKIDALSEKYGLTFPKGVSAAVKEVRKQFIKKFGAEKLSEVAKLHFNLK